MTTSKHLFLPLLLAFALLAPGQLAAQSKDDKKGPVYRRNRGVLIFSDKPFVTPDTTKAFGKMVRKARRAKVLKADASGKWTFHFIAFLKRAPRADKVNLVWYRLGKKREQVDFTEFVVTPDEVTLQAKAKLSSAIFNRGDRLEARITRLIGRKEVVYARCRLQLQ